MSGEGNWSTQKAALLFQGSGAPGITVVGGQHTTVAAADTVASGLSSVLFVIAQLDDDPVDGCMHVTSKASTGGNIIISTWLSTDGDATLAVATTFSKKVNWLAVGYP